VKAVVFWVLLVIVSVKDFAYLWTVGWFVARGGEHAERLRNHDPTLRANAPAAANPVDRLLARLVPAHSRVGTGLLALYTTPSVVTFAAIGVFAFGRSGDASLRLAVASAVALCVMLALVIAVLRRLVLGEYDAETSDVQLPAFTKNWAASRDDGANNTVYFLVLLYLSTVGFAALYFALALGSTNALAHFGVPSVSSSLYFSVITLATVGYGDVHATSTAAKWIVMAQISTGPLLLSWLLAVFLTSRANTGD
jgi:Ion channel